MADPPIPEDRLAAAGVTVDRVANRVVWRLGRVPAAVTQLVWADNVVSLAAVVETGAGIVLQVDAGKPFDLEVETAFTTFYESVPAGRTRYVLTVLDRTDVRDD